MEHRIVETLATLIPAAVGLCALALVGGCQDDVSLANLPGHVTFVGPTVASGEDVTTWFGVSDPEGDFVSVSVEVCVQGGGCFVPELRPGSATIDTLPSARPEVSPALKVIWRPECPPLETDTPFTVHIQAMTSTLEGRLDGVQSEPMTLEDLGLSCE